MITKENIFHYTSFDKFKCILQNGTLRFKESTQSNDMLDTQGLINILKSMQEMKSKNNQFSEFFNFLIGYYKRKEYKTTCTSLVSCFSAISDSRLLWDAYTMNRPSNIKCSYGKNKYCVTSSSKYNGACIAFRRDKLFDCIERVNRKNCDKVFLQKVRYGEDAIKATLNEYLKGAMFESFQLSKDEDQKQDKVPPIRVKIFSKTYEFTLKKNLVEPMLSFITRIEELSPFFKHAFWREEQETRASLFMNNERCRLYNIKEDSNGAKYFDVPISSDCIDYIILGPEFGDKEKNEILNNDDYKLDFSKIKQTRSIGTGVIVSK